jgi:ubiquinone/menaquinone biosynthesis C-methylase UbiE
MKGRESGMPDEADWEAFFNVPAALDRLLTTGLVDGDAVEFGCGYGTFTIPAARRTAGIFTALDIEPEMVRLTSEKATRLSLANVRTEARDFAVDGTGLEASSQAHAMIYNLLHIEEPLTLLREARRVVKAGGILSVMHWRNDVDTPRGPPIEMRPSPEQCRTWMHGAGFRGVRLVDLGDVCPHHFALLGT